MKYKPSFYNFLIPVPEKSIFLIYNILYGGFYELTNEEGELLDKIDKMEYILLDDIPIKYHEFIRNMYDKKFFFKSDFDEDKEIITRYNYNRDNNYRKSPIAVTIMPTLSCNLACRYCFQNGAKATFLKKTTISDIVNFLGKKIAEKETSEKNINITWFGGEPLLGIKQIQELTPLLYKLAKKMVISMKQKL
jgi:uncharacterized protein